MLILTRRNGETLMVRDDVAITVLGVHGNQVRIGTNAPKDIPVHREEIYERIQADKYATGGSSDRQTEESQPLGETGVGESDRLSGTISHLNRKGYGFIYVPGYDDRIYFHARSILADVAFSELDEGQEVEFSISEGIEGFVASEIHLVSERE